MREAIYKSHKVHVLSAENRMRGLLVGIASKHLSAVTAIALNSWDIPQRSLSCLRILLPTPDWV